MSAHLPFEISPDAADYLLQHLSVSPSGQEPALITVLARGERSGDTMRSWYEGEHFMIGYYQVGERPQAQYIELLGQRVSIIPETLQRLSGRTLALRHVVERRGWFRKVTRDVLVAA